jgi:hypothetical protein
MAFTQTQLDAIEEAIAAGALTVKYADKEVTYRSLNEMLRVRDMISRKLGNKIAGAGRVYPTLGKGLSGE